jgi:hypothetical protein
MTIGCRGMEVKLHEFLTSTQDVGEHSDFFGLFIPEDRALVAFGDQLRY